MVSLEYPITKKHTLVRARISFLPSLPQHSHAPTHNNTCINACILDWSNGSALLGAADNFSNVKLGLWYGTSKVTGATVPQTTFYYEW